MGTQLLTVQEAADQLAVHRQSVYRLIWAGELTVTNVGQGRRRPRLRIIAESVEAYIERNTMPAGVS